MIHCKTSTSLPSPKSQPIKVLVEGTPRTAAWESEAGNCGGGGWTVGWFQSCDSVTLTHLFIFCYAQPSNSPMAFHLPPPSSLCLCHPWIWRPTTKAAPRTQSSDATAFFFFLFLPQWLAVTAASCHVMLALALGTRGDGVARLG